MEIRDVRETWPWNPRRGKWDQRDLSVVNKIILHQELGESTGRGVHDYHTSINCHISPGKGTPRICYHFVIEKDGVVYWCNNLDDVVWHTKGQNTSGVGIMLQGDFDGIGHQGKSQPTQAQEESFYELVDMLTSELEIPYSEIYGHCDFGKPACPGTIPYTWIENIKK